MKQLVIPIIVILLLLGLFIPIPQEALDYLVITNCIFGFILLLSVLLVRRPLSLSTFPSFLLILTLFRLVTNVSSTRQILSGIQPGTIIPLIGEVAIQGSLIIGTVIFLILTCIQLIVISKGAERVAEVSARFTLDALPGKQMSIDADVRAGLIDFSEARMKRQELQAESRFYGALDGAMKFIKGDAIIGILITAINLIGGLVIGMTLHQLDFNLALAQYSLLTIGDGVISQLPAILNSIAAGILVTRVVNYEQFNLSQELFMQIFGEKSVQALIISFCLLLAVMPGLPAVPFLCFAVLCLILYFAAKTMLPENLSDPQKPIYSHESELLRIEIPKILFNNTENFKFLFIKDFFQVTGLLLNQLEINSTESKNIKIYFHNYCIQELEDNCSSKEIINLLVKQVKNFSHELINDQVVKNLLDYQQQLGESQYLQLVPEVVPLSKISRIYKALAEEEVMPIKLDLVLQVLSEHVEDKIDIRLLIKEVRIAHKYQISQNFSRGVELKAITLAPEIDLHFYQIEQQVKEINPEYIQKILDSSKDIITEGAQEKVTLVTSANSRMIISDCLKVLGAKIRVLAFEELIPQINIVNLAYVNFEQGSGSRLGQEGEKA